ncbi:MAG: hypothetical protein DBX44_06860 [Oscillospiraceae bacterium]|nr:MAG: hypothetical protein DBX44_06860 [Oscillospiraceae bacterium]
MKKILLVVLALAMVLSLAACGGSSAPASSAPASVASETPSSESASAESSSAGGFKEMDEAYLTLAAGANGGGWYIMGAAFNDAWEQNLPVHMTLLPGGGSSNPSLVNDGTDVQIGFTYVATAVSAVNGQFEFEGAACSDMMALGSLNIKQFLAINTTEDFTSVEDMVANPGKLKIAVGPRAGGNEVMFNRYLETANSSLDALASAGADVQYISTNEGLTAIKDGILNTAVNLHAPPMGSIVEALASVKMSFIELDATAAQAVCDKYGYGYGPIPGGTYQYQDEDVNTLYDTVLLVINKNIDDAVAYNLAKVLYENRDSFVAAYAGLESFDPAALADCGIELHPGAKAFYEEVGIL